MNRLTLASCRPAIAKALGVCESDDRVVTALNEAQERLMLKGKWVGTTVRYRVCLTEGCLTWPRQIETIEAFAVCGWPGRVRDTWFEFLGNGFGIMSADCGCGSTLVDRDPGPTFDSIFGSDKRLRLYSDEEEAEDAWVLIQGYDENANWIRTLDGNIFIDGEYMLATNAGSTSTSLFTSVTGVIKPVTNGSLRLYEYDPATLGQRTIAIWENDETHPHYRKSLIPGLGNQHGCGSSTSTDDASCQTQAVTVMAKLRHIPVRNDNDWLTLGNLPALRFMVQAIEKERKNLLDEAIAYEGTAVRLLEEELSSYQGDGMVTQIRVAAGSEWAGGGVVNFIS